MPNETTPPRGPARPATPAPAPKRIVHHGQPHGLRPVVDPAVGRSRKPEPKPIPKERRPIPADPLDQEIEKDIAREGPYTTIQNKRADPIPAVVPSKKTGLIRHTPQQSRPPMMPPANADTQRELNQVGRPLLAAAQQSSETEEEQEDQSSVLSGMKQTLIGSAGILPPVVHVTRSERSPLSLDIPLVRSTEVPKGFTRITPPSLCVPYEFQELFIRPFDIEVLSNVIAAVQQGSYTMMLDALAPCVYQDIRDLTETDLRFCMYWWRLNSYTRSPFTVTWKSRYGNECVTSITEGKMKIERLKMTREEMESYREKGIRMPTVRDGEAIRGHDKTVEEAQKQKTMWLLQRAQYVHLAEEVAPEDYYTARLAEMHTKGVEFLEDIRDFAQKITHGVTEIIDDTDNKFEPEAAAKFLRQTASILREFQEGNPGMGAETLLSYADKIGELLAEAEEIETLLAEGKVPQPRKEGVVLTFDIMSCFPGI